MRQLDDLAQNGEVHHYAADTGLYLLLFHTKDIAPEHKQAALDLRTRIGVKPSKAETLAVIQAAFDLLNTVRAQIEGPNYSAVWAHLNHAKECASR